MHVSNIKLTCIHIRCDATNDFICYVEAHYLSKEKAGQYFSCIESFPKRRDYVVPRRRL